MSGTKGRKAVRVVCAACADRQRHVPNSTWVEVAAVYLSTQGDLWEYVMGPKGWLVNGKRLPTTVRGQTGLGDQLVAECQKHGALWVHEPAVTDAVAAFKKSGTVSTVLFSPSTRSSTALR